MAYAKALNKIFSFMTTYQTNLDIALKDFMHNAKNKDIAAEAAAKLFPNSVDKIKEMFDIDIKDTIDVNTLDTTNKLAKDVSASSASSQNELATSDEAKEATKSACGKMFTALGIARLIAKSTGVIVNNGAKFTNLLSKQAIKMKEDKHVIAAMNFIV